MPQLIASVEGVVTKQVYLHKDRTTLGRRPDNDIVLADSAVSGEHCAFHLKGLADVYVEDLGSTNGTYINDKMVKHQRLRDGDLITIGRFRVQYLSASEPSEFGQTAALGLEGYGTNGPVVPLHASLRVLSGSSAGLEMPVVKAVATFGKPGVAIVAIAHRRQGYFISCMEGKTPPTLNGMALRDDPVILSDGDILDLAGTQMQFRLSA